MNNKWLSHYEMTCRMKQNKKIPKKKSKLRSVKSFDDATSESATSARSDDFSVGSHNSRFLEIRQQNLKSFDPLEYAKSHDVRQSGVGLSSSHIARELNCPIALNVNLAPETKRTTFSFQPLKRSSSRCSTSGAQPIQKSLSLPPWEDMLSPIKKSPAPIKYQRQLSYPISLPPIISPRLETVQHTSDKVSPEQITSFSSPWDHLCQKLRRAGSFITTHDIAEWASYTSPPSSMLPAFTYLHLLLFGAEVEDDPSSYTLSMADYKSLLRQANTIVRYIKEIEPRNIPALNRSMAIEYFAAVMQGKMVSPLHKSNKTFGKLLKYVIL